SDLPEGGERIEGLRPRRSALGRRLRWRDLRRIGGCVGRLSRLRARGCLRTAGCLCRRRKGLPGLLRRRSETFARALGFLQALGFKGSLAFGLLAGAVLIEPAKALQFVDLALHATDAQFALERVDLHLRIEALELGERPGPDDGDA